MSRITSLIQILREIRTDYASDSSVGDDFGWIIDRILPLPNLPENTDSFRTSLAGKMEEAFKLANQEAQSRYNDSFKISEYGWIVSAHVKAGMRDEAVEVLEQSDKLAERISSKVPHWKSDVYLQLVQTQVELGMFDEALQTTKVIGDDWNKSLAYSRVADAQAKKDANKAKEAFRLALEAAGNVADESRKISTHSFIASLQSKAGLLDEARETVGLVYKLKENIELDPDSVSYQLLTEALINLKDYDGAKNFLSGLPDSFKSRHLWSIAHAQARDGLYKQAKRTAASIRDKELRQGAYCKIAFCQAEQGDLSGALKTSRKAYKPRAYMNIALLQAKERSYKDAERTLNWALKSAKKVKDSYWESLVYLSMASLQLQQGERGKSEEYLMLAFSLAGSTDLRGLRIQTYSDIGLLQAKLGNVEETKDTFGLVLECASQEENELTRFRNYADIESRQRKAGLYEDAAKTLDLSLQLVKDARYMGSKSYKYANIALSYHTLLQSLEAA